MCDATLCPTNWAISQLTQRQHSASLKRCAGKGPALPKRESDRVAAAETNRRSRPKFVAYLVPLGAVVAALAIGALMLSLLGASPIDGFREMFKGAFGSKDALVETALKATPLLFVGV